VLKQGFEAGQPDAVTRYFSLVLEASVYPAGIKGAAKVAFVPESKQLVVECDLPAFDAIPEAGAYKYVKAQDQIAESPRPASQRRALYASVLAQMTLRTLHELFEADRMQKLGTVVFNGYVDTIDRATGRRMRPCLITVRTTREAFEQLDLSRVDPIACLKALNAGASLKSTPPCCSVVPQAWVRPSSRKHWGSKRAGRGSGCCSPRPARFWPTSLVAALTGVPQAGCGATSGRNWSSSMTLGCASTRCP